MNTFQSVKQRLKKQLEFIIEIDKIKQIFRKTLLFDSSRYENDAEHAWHLALMAMVLTEYSNETVDLSKVLKMVLIHDIVEIDCGDTIFYNDSERKQKIEQEKKAAERIFGILPDDQKIEFITLWQEFEENQTAESHFARALDRLEPILQNILTDGHAWQQNGISKDQVLLKNSGIIKAGSVKLWNVIEQIICEAVSSGSLKI